MPELFADNKRHDPFRKFNFEVKFQRPTGVSGVPIQPPTNIPFSEVDGLRAETEIVEYKEGDRRYNRKIPGKTSFDNIVLARGLDPEGRLSLWFQRITEAGTSGSEENLRMDAIISVFTRNQADLVAQWHAKNTWPTAYETEDLSGDASDILIVRLELAVEELRQILPIGSRKPTLTDSFSFNA